MSEEKTELVESKREMFNISGPPEFKSKSPTKPNCDHELRWHYIIDGQPEHYMYGVEEYSWCDNAHQERLVSTFKLRYHHVRALLGFCPRKLGIEQHMWIYLPFHFKPSHVAPTHLHHFSFLKWWLEDHFCMLPFSVEVFRYVPNVHETLDEQAKGKPTRFL